MSFEDIERWGFSGIGVRRVQATLRRALTADERAAFDRGVVARRLRIAEKKERGPMSVAERVRKHVANANDIKEIPPVRHVRLKARCRDDLEAFGWYYCRSILRHRASKDIRDGLIHDIQECILKGGKAVKMYGRGTGKTTWVDDIATLWAVLYGHRRFPVAIAATGRQAKRNLKRIKKLLTRSDEIAADFPAIAIPLRELGGISQRASSQTYRGEPTDCEWGTDQIVLPTLRDEFGNTLDEGCGAVVAAVGIGGAIRGANESGQRPDFLILDDPQTKKSAHSPKMVADIIDYIHQDALFLAGHDSSMSAFVTITPQCYGDVATELSSQSKHPEWSVSIEPFVKSVCPAWTRLVADYCREYVDDMANHDYALTRSRSWYLLHRDEFAGVETIDPEQYDHEREVDAVHHVLNLRASLGEVAFNAEIMMQVADVQSELNVTPDLVAGRVNGFERGELPTGTDCAVAFCDVNTRAGAGLSWAVVAFGPGRVAAVVDYGRYPERGPLVEKNASARARATAVAAAMHQVTAKIAGLRLFRRVGDRRIPIRVTALGFDRGFMPDVIHRVRNVLAKTGYYANGERHLDGGREAARLPVPFPLVCVRGFSWNRYGTRKKDMIRRGDHVHASRSQYGEYLAEMAPYWREIMQSGFMETPLMPGSLSIFGRNSVEHYAFAQEVCAEKLVRKYVHPTGVLAWDWATTGAEHWCDALTGCFALASWFRCYDAVSATVDGAAMLAPPRRREVHQDDLFDPVRNPALAASAAAAPDDATEGTGEAVPPTMPADNERVFSFAEASRVKHAPRATWGRGKQIVVKGRRGAWWKKGRGRW